MRPGLPEGRSFWKKDKGYCILAIEVGSIFEGKVTGVKPFGAFVALPEGQVGMVHISEVANEFVQDITAILHEGQQVKVKVINVAPDGKIGLSIKRLLAPAPRASREDRRGAPAGGKRPARSAHSDAPRVWQPKAPARSDNLSFEDMMSRFKSQSEEKIADLNHETNNRRGGGYAPRGRRGGR